MCNPGEERRRQECFSSLISGATLNRISCNTPGLVHSGVSLFLFILREANFVQSFAKILSSRFFPQRLFEDSR